MTKIENREIIYLNLKINLQWMLVEESDRLEKVNTVLNL